MADEWYYTEKGQQRGPVTTAELRRMAAASRLSPTDLVWKEGLPKWVPAGTTAGLFPEGQAAGVSVAQADEERPRRRRREREVESRPRKRARGGPGVAVIL